MAQNEEILISIDKEGKITIEAQGFSGNTCSSEMEKIISGLGGRSVAKKNTADWYKKQGVHIHQKNQ